MFATSLNGTKKVQTFVPQSQLDQLAKLVDIFESRFEILIFLELTVGKTFKN